MTAVPIIAAVVTKQAENVPNDNQNDLSERNAYADVVR